MRDGDWCPACGLEWQVRMCVPGKCNNPEARAMALLRKIVDAYAATKTEAGRDWDGDDELIIEACDILGVPVPLARAWKPPSGE